MRKAPTTRLARVREEEHSLDDVQSAVSRAVSCCSATPACAHDAPCCHMPYAREVFADHVIVQDCDGCCYSVPFTVDADLKVTLGERTKVEQTWTTVKEHFEQPVSRVRVSEGGKIEIVAIRSGLSMNRGQWGQILHAREAVRAIPSVLEGGKVGVFDFGATLGHLTAKNASDLKRVLVMHSVGTLRQVRIEEAADGEVEAVATLELEDGLPERLLKKLREGEVGFSIDLDCKVGPAIHEGRAVTRVERYCESEDGMVLDIVSTPAAGGRVVRVAASVFSLGGSSMCPKCKASPCACAANAVAPAPNATAVLDDPATLRAREAAEKAARETEEILKRARIREAAGIVETRLMESKLPAKARDLVRARFKDAEVVKDEDITAEITKVREALAEADPSGRVRVAAGISVGAEPRDKLLLGMESLFVRRNSPSYVDRDESGKPLADRLREAGVDRLGSHLRFFNEVTGLQLIDLKSGSKERSGRVREAISSTTWDDAWENVLNRVFLRWYENPDFSGWKKVARIGEAQNFVKKEFIVKGGYGNLPEVPQGTNFEALTTPADNGHGYTPKVYGGTESITWQAMLRDDVGALADVPMALGLSAARTLYEFAMDFFTIAGAPTMEYDSVNLYHTTNPTAKPRNNLLTTALSNAALIASIKQMLKQTQITNGKRMLILPRTVLVPIDKMDTIDDILRPTSELSPGSTQANQWLLKMGLQYEVVRHWSNTGDWFVVADPATTPSLVIDFVGGQEQPRLDIMDRAAGTWFSSLTETLRIYHPYGGTIVRHEGVQANDV